MVTVMASGSGKRKWLTVPGSGGSSSDGSEIGTWKFIDMQM